MSGIFLNQNYIKLWKKYGFSDYHGIGDIIGHSKGGYFYDSTTTAQTINWLRCKGQPLNDQHKPLVPGR